MKLDRRDFLITAGAGLGTAWLGANWSAALAASAHSRAAVASATPPKFEFFTPEQATEVAAICARIIPSDDSPGATEVGAVYFIDRGLITISPEAQPIYRDGLPQFQGKFHAMFPGAGRFSAASAERQDQFLRAEDNVGKPVGRRQRASSDAPTFFETVRVHTIAAFLIDPESDYAGNRSGVGWQVVGRESAHTFQPPFGFYDKDYPGWSPSPAAAKAK
jgi:gluconate 2-dehydrogenase gamma chain